MKLNKIMKLSLLHFALFSLVIAVADADQKSSDLRLVTASESYYAIVAASGKDAVTDRAVEELRLFLKNSTGVDFPVKTPEQTEKSTKRIIIGDNELSRRILGKETIAGLLPEESLVISRGEDLLLVGGNPRGTLYAVYSFLENELGCRCFNAYGDQLVPHHKTLTIPAVTRREKPAFAHRFIVHYFYADSQAKSLFLQRNRLNGVGSGIPIDLPAIGPGVHTLFFYLNPHKDFSSWGRTLPKNDFYAVHPEFFSLDAQGKRTDKLQLCFSNREMRRTFTAQVMDMIANSPYRNGGVVSVSANDVPGRFCHCSECSALERKYGVLSGPMIDYLIELCGVLKKSYPEVYIDTLAYRKLQSELPPKIKSLPENLIITFAPIYDNFAVPLDHPANAETLKNLQTWCKIAKHVRVWYYPNPYLSCPPPFGNLQRLIRDIRLIRQAGADGTFFEQDAGGILWGGNFTELQTWAMLKLFQAPECDTETLIREFTDFYYGAAATDIRQYLAELEGLRIREMPSLPWNPSVAMFAYLTPERIIAWEKMFDRLENIPTITQFQRDNLKTLRISLDLMLLHHWQKISVADTRIETTLPQLLNRIRNNFLEAVQKRITKQPQREAVKKKFDQMLTDMEFKASINPRPLPEPFRSMAPEAVKRIYPFFDKKREQDPMAAGGAAAVCDIRQLPVKIGVYDLTKTKKLQLIRSINQAEIKTEGYNLYKIGRSVLTPQCCLWITESWGITVPLEEYFIAGDPFVEWDIYASLKFQVNSDGLPRESKANRVYCDQVILVRVPDNASSR